MRKAFTKIFVALAVVVLSTVLLISSTVAFKNGYVHAETTDDVSYVSVETSKTYDGSVTTASDIGVALVFNFTSIWDSLPFDITIVDLSLYVNDTLIRNAKDGTYDVFPTKSDGSVVIPEGTATTASIAFSNTSIGRTDAIAVGDKVCVKFQIKLSGLSKDEIQKLLDNGDVFSSYLWTHGFYFDSIPNKSLMTPGTKASIKTMIDAADLLDENDYEASSYNRFWLALQAARKVYKESGTPAEIIYAKLTLQEAENNLSKLSNFDNDGYAIIERTSTLVATGSTLSVTMRFLSYDSTTLPYKVEIKKVEAYDSNGTLLDTAPMSDGYTIAKGTATGAYNIDGSAYAVETVASGGTFTSPAGTKITLKYYIKISDIDELYKDKNLIWSITWQGGWTEFITSTKNPVTSSTFLKLTANKKDLRQLVVESEAIDTTKYTAASIATLENKISAAYTALAVDYPTQASIDQAKTDLSNAKDALSFIMYTVSFSDGVAPESVKIGEKATEPTEPVRTGYTFKGWMNGETLYDFNTPITSDITLTAKWEEIKYTVSFSDGVGSEMVKYGDKATEPTEPVRTGYTFKGWMKGNTAYDFNTVVTGDISLTAKWEIIVLTVTFSDGLEDKKVNYGEKIEAPSEPTKEGYIFKGWMNGETVYDFNTVVTGNLNLTSKWEIIVFTITFSDGIESENVNYGEKAQIPTDPIKTGYTFKGWYNGEALYDFNQAVKANITLAAKFEVINLIVTFTDGVEAETVKYGEKVVAPTDPSKEGYTFGGWMNGDQLYDFNQVVTENLALTAKWNEVKKPGLGKTGIIIISVSSVLVVGLASVFIVLKLKKKKIV